MSHRLLAVVLLFALAGCATVRGPRASAVEEEWKTLEKDYEWIATIRRSAPVTDPTASRRAQIESLLEAHRKVDPALVPFLERLRAFYDRTGDQRAAEIWAREKVIMGDEYMSVLSRFDRAIELYRSALEVAPGDSEILDRIAMAEKRRFVDPASFDEVEAGMTESDVEDILGRPREDWIKHQTRDNHLYSVWIYPKRQGGAAAVYFDNGLVYHVDWDAAANK